MWPHTTQLIKEAYLTHTDAFVVVVVVSSSGPYSDGKRTAAMGIRRSSSSSCNLLDTQSLKCPPSRTNAQKER